ncbi:hypothetical protein [Streptomyces sp. NPDC012888]|uniref:hypothetical protein n=1 Tax=Streptomyces sp. NPDC012888 TaxID=3364855 RepID=UPI0036877303
MSNPHFTPAGNGKVYANTTKGARELAKDAKVGMVLYKVNRHALVAGQFEEYTYSPVHCTHWSRLCGVWMFSPVPHIKGSLTHERLVCGIYLGTTPPEGLRDLAGPEPDCRDEGAYGLKRGELFGGRLDPAEIDYMERLAKQAVAERHERGKRLGHVTEDENGKVTTKRGWW